MASRKIRMNRWGLLENPAGLCVKMMFKGRELLGKVQDVRREDAGVPGFRLDVTFFNGEPWPIRPGVLAVNII